IVRSEGTRRSPVHSSGGSEPRVDTDWHRQGMDLELQNAATTAIKPALVYPLPPLKNPYYRKQMTWRVSSRKQSAYLVLLKTNGLMKNGPTDGRAFVLSCLHLLYQLKTEKLPRLYCWCSEG